MLGKYKTAALLVILVLACAACIWAVPSQVNKLGLSRDGSFTVLTIYGSDQLRYAHQSVEAKEGRPFRIVIDCLASRHGLPQKEYLDLPRSIIKSIRSSQYSVTPEEVVRVVLDLNEESIYRVESDENALKVFVSDQKTAPFAQWASTKVKSQPLTVATPEAKTEKQTVKKPTPKTSAETKVVATATQTEAKKPVPSVAKKPSVVKKNENQAKTVAKKENQAKTVAKNENQAKTVAQKTTDGYRRPTNSDYLISSPALATVAKAPAKKAPAVSKTVEPAQKTTVADNKAKTTTPIVASADEKKTVKKSPAVKQQQKKETPTVAVKTEKPKAQPKKEAQPVVAKVEKPAAQPKQAVQTKPALNKDLAKDTIAKSKVFASINTGQKSPDPGITSDKPAVDVHKTVQAKPAAPPKQKNEVVLASTDNAAAKPAAPSVAKTDNVDKIKTSKYRRESAKSAEFKATQVVQFPSRMVIKYKRTNPRDPFESLISADKKRKGNVDLKHIPNIETLNLVGILEPDAGKGAALMEDLDGIGYILRPGDRVKNGYVAQIDKSAVYFQINEYGWGRTIVKHMEKDN